LAEAGFTGFVIGLGVYLPETDGLSPPGWGLKLNLNSWLGVGFAF